MRQGIGDEDEKGEGREGRANVLMMSEWGEGGWMGRKEWQNEEDKEERAR